MGKCSKKCSPGSPAHAIHGTSRIHAIKTHSQTETKERILHEQVSDVAFCSTTQSKVHSIAIVVHAHTTHVNIHSIRIHTRLAHAVLLLLVLLLGLHLRLLLLLLLLLCLHLIPSCWTLLLGHLLHCLLVILRWLHVLIMWGVGCGDFAEEVEG